MTESLASHLINDGVLSQAQIQIAQEIAQMQMSAIDYLEMESNVYITNSNLTLVQKREKVIQMQYNQRVQDILRDGNNLLLNKLDARSYAKLKEWILRRWELEKQIHGVYQGKASARTSKIFATRYDSKGAYIVALPDKCLKFANAGNHVCDDIGYAVGQDYTVYLSYTKSTAATVLEAGPWNIDDNYWSGIYDPQPRRMFTDLAIGMPEAQAAYFNDYNGGLDQYGRKVTAPFGIDLAPEVSNDIGLKGSMNDWITITFMWTDGWNNSSGSASSGDTVTKKIIIATPNPDGSIIHEVQTGQFLSSIADVYQVELHDLLELNNLKPDSFIFPGDRLLIKPATQGSSTPAVTQVNQPTKTNQLIPTTAVATISQSGTDQNRFGPAFTQSNLTDTEIRSNDSMDNSKTVLDPILLGIMGTVVIGVTLVLMGTMFRKRNQ